MIGFLAVLFLIAGLVALALSRAARDESGLPRGEVIYSDTRAWGPVEKPLFSSAYRIAGKPDYLVKDGRAIVPVEVKSSRVPPNGPHASHIMQLAAYFLLVEETHGRRPPYGIVKYADGTLSIEHTDRLRSSLLDMLDEMRLAASENEAHRSHSDPRRCANCGYRHACDERLA
ncbi:MAG TPA: CRISPR-associated protein Cas4 [Anaerolineae bacterium]|nr:CRISPR-associated protein Cas4 [Anaerolineae bacterium]